MKQVTAKKTPVIAGQEALIAQALTYDFVAIADIGAGNGVAAERFYYSGKQVTATRFEIESHTEVHLPKEITVYDGLDICDMKPLSDAIFDAVWCAHVIEHTLDTGRALGEIRRILKPSGWLFLMVPPYKPYVVGGHVTPGWNIGILMYVLILTGFEVWSGSFIRHGYNIAAFVRKGEMPNVHLLHAGGDIERLASLFPIPAYQGFNGDLKKVNWDWNIDKSLYKADLAAWLRRAFGQPRF